jgi:hypothetical protein
LRRQAKLGASLPFQFPALPLNANPFKVEVLKPICSKNVALSVDADRYIVRFPDSGDGLSQLQLLVQDSLGLATISAEGPAPVAQKDGGAADVSAEKDGDAAEDSAKKKAEAAAAAREFLQKHSMVAYVQDMLARVLKERPEDPYKFMCAHAKGGLGQGEDLDNFGDDAPEAAAQKADNDGLDDAGEEWRGRPSEAWQLQGKHCQLTTSVNRASKEQRFEMLMPDGQTLTMQIGQADFDGLMAEQKGLEGPAQTAAAINQLFMEGISELEKQAEPMVQPPEDVTQQGMSASAATTLPKMLVSVGIVVLSGHSWRMQQ